MQKTNLEDVRKAGQGYCSGCGIGYSHEPRFPSPHPMGRGDSRWPRRVAWFHFCSLSHGLSSKALLPQLLPFSGLPILRFGLW